jgi:hypothetical protein
LNLDGRRADERAMGNMQPTKDRTMGNELYIPNSQHPTHNHTYRYNQQERKIKKQRGSTVHGPPTVSTMTEATARIARSDMPLRNMILLFGVFPLIIGTLGLYMGYLAKLKTGEELSFDQDFVMPFLLALGMSIVIGLQTRGYADKKVQPLVQWPKARRVKTIVKVKRRKED